VCVCEDLGILFDNHLKFHNHVSTVSAKANHVLGLIGKSFKFLDTEMVVKLFKTLECLILEYVNFIWELNPLFWIKEKLNTYNTELLILFLPLEPISILRDLLFWTYHLWIIARQIKGDLILMYKIVNNHFNSDFSNLHIFNKHNQGSQF